MILLSAMTAPIHAGPPTGDLKIYFLDVGLGDALLIDQPGVCTLLVDAGPLIHGHRITQKLSDLKINKLDAVIITHPHIDHFGGLFDIHPRISIKQIYDNGRTNPAREYFSDYQKIIKKQQYKTISKGDVITYGDIDITVLSPQDSAQGNRSLNETSLVLMISYKNFNLLHMGDLAGPAEKTFINSSSEIAADVIKIAHHGAADATPGILLDKVNPTLAVISTSEDNWINAPSPEVIDNLETRGIKYYRTDIHRTIELTITENGQFSVSHGK